MTPSAPAPSPAKRLAALLVFIALPLALAVMTALNGWGTVELSALSQTTEAQLSRLAGRAPPAGAAGARQDLSPIFVGAASRSLAEAELQRGLITIIEAIPARVVESGAVEARDAGSEVIEVRATLDTDNDGLLRLLHAIETGIPLLSVEELAVRHLQSEASASGSAPELRVDLRVLGRWRSTLP